MSEVRRLHFGTFAVRQGGGGTITVTPDNSTYADSGIVLGEDGQRGEYLFTGLPPNVPFYLGIDVPNSPSEGGVVLQSDEAATLGGGPALTLYNLTMGNGGVMHSDSLGEAMLYVGGTIRTSGNGANYAGGTYMGTYTITIHY